MSVLADRNYTAGAHNLGWNGFHDRGYAMPSGTYLLRLETDSAVKATELNLIR